MIYKTCMAMQVSKDEEVLLTQTVPGGLPIANAKPNLYSIFCEAENKEEAFQIILKKIAYNLAICMDTLEGVNPSNDDSLLCNVIEKMDFSL